jgi:UDP-3-O-[3-hydroxymyristoyl] glucosamine N-acyltransferase
MYKIKKNSIETFDISNYLNQKLVFDKDYVIKQPSSLSEIENNCITFTNDISIEELLLIEKESVILTNKINLQDINKELIIPELIFTEEPEKDFYLIVKEFFIEDEIFSISKSALINNKVDIGINVNIGDGSNISENVKIGNNTFIGKNVIIHNNVSIGSNCYLKDGSIIGSDSFKFIKEDDKYSYIPFLGNLIIENDVWIGSNVVIEKSAIGNMKISNDVKIDDLVQIGSDCNIKEHTQIAAGSIIGRDVNIGSNCILGINTIVKPEIKISDNVKIGMGTVVIKNLKSDNIYVGNPAHKLEKNEGMM